MKEKTILKIAILLIIIALIIFLVITIPNITSNIIKGYYHSYTQALCDENNYCKDYEVKCQGKKNISLTPTAFAVQQDEDWKDFRNEDEICRD